MSLLKEMSEAFKWDYQKVLVTQVSRCQSACRYVNLKISFIDSLINIFFTQFHPDIDRAKHPGIGLFHHNGRLR